MQEFGEEDGASAQTSSVRKKLENELDSHSIDSDEYQDYESHPSARGSKLAHNMTPSSTADSIAEANVKGRMHLVFPK